MALRKLASGFNRDVPPVWIAIDQRRFLALYECDPVLCCADRFRLSVEPSDSCNECPHLSLRLSELPFAHLSIVCDLKIVSHRERSLG